MAVAQLLPRVATQVGALKASLCDHRMLNEVNVAVLRPEGPVTVDLLIRHGVVVALDARRQTLFDGTVAIDGNRIVAVGPDSEIAKAYSARRTILAHHRAVLPGFVDTHHHFLQSFLKGARDDLPFPEWVREVSSPLIKIAVDECREGHSELQRHATRIGCIEALKAGVTTILNMEWATQPSVIDVYQEMGIRAVHTLTLSDVDHWGRPGMLLDMADSWALCERLQDRCRLSDGGRISFRYGLACENSASPALLREVRARATSTGVGIHIHLAESKWGWENIHRLHGMTPVAYLNGLGFLGPDVLAAHCIWLAAEDERILANACVPISYTPKCHMKLALGVAPVVKLLAKGVTVSLGTDTCAVNDNIDLFEEMRSAAFLQRISNMNPFALSAYQALEMATIGGATALGMANEIGSIEPGKRADLILVDLDCPHLRPINEIINNLVFAAHASDVETVLVDGQIVVEHSKVCAVDEQQSIDLAEAYALERFRQAGVQTSPQNRPLERLQ